MRQLNVDNVKKVGEGKERGGEGTPNSIITLVWFLNDHLTCAPISPDGLQSPIIDHSTRIINSENSDALPVCLHYHNNNAWN